MTGIAPAMWRSAADRWPSLRFLALLTAPTVAFLLLLLFALIAGAGHSAAASGNATIPQDGTGPDLALDYRVTVPTGCAAGATPDCIGPHQGRVELYYRNIGNQDATGVVVTVTLTVSPTGCSIGSSLNQMGCQWDGTTQRLSCPIIVGDLTVGQVKGVPFYTVNWCNPSPGGVAQITTDITAADDGTHGPDLAPENNTYRSIMSFTYATQLYLRLTSQSTFALPGGTIAYDLVVGSWSTQAVFGAVITETVPAHTTFNPDQSAPGWQCTPDDAAGSICTLAPAYDPWNEYNGFGYGMTLSPIRFAVTVNNTLPAGVEAITNTAQVGDDGYGGPDTVPEDNISTSVIPIAAPTSITVVDFAAARTSTGTVLTWATIGETTELGYNIHRSITPEGRRVRVNAELLPALRDPAGATYKLMDVGFPFDEGVSYWLEIVSAQASTWIGPIEAPWRTRLFLPLVVRAN